MQVQKTNKSKKCCPRCCIGTIIYLFVLLLLLFLVVFVIAPVVFKFSIEIQRSIIFPTWFAGSANFSDVEKFGLKGVRNFYVTVDDDDNVTLGVWQILPDEITSDFIRNDQYNYEGILADRKYDVLLYLHGNGALRSIPIKLYDVLRKNFHIIACDYRGYGDSSKGTLSEDDIVNDVVYLYKWLRERTDARIFFWGHSLGTGVSTHAISNLKAQNHTPSGLILETPFSSVTDVMERHFLVKFYSWLPWCKSTILDPIVYNGFGFESTKYIVDVDCPIMILHAKDDSVIPYELATKLYETAVNERNLLVQGNVTYHLFEALGYDHMYLYLAPELPTYVSEFLEECLDFERRSIHDDTDVEM